MLKKLVNDLYFPKLIDVGCACGGLYPALLQINKNIIYSGLDIDKESIDFAKSTYKNIDFYNTDFMSFFKTSSIKYDIIISLSCIDWNTIDSDFEFQDVIQMLFDNLKTEGSLIISLRIHKTRSYFNSKKSFQILTQGEKKIKASYGVISETELLKCLKSLNIKKLTASAFYGKPSSTAITPEKKLLFCVLGITKGKKEINEIEYSLEVPDDFRNALINIKKKQIKKNESNWCGAS